jgi:hypothetical protein
MGRVLETINTMRRDVQRTDGIGKNIHFRPVITGVAHPQVINVAECAAAVSATRA